MEGFNIERETRKLPLKKGKSKLKRKIKNLALFLLSSAIIISSSECSGLLAGVPFYSNPTDPIGAVATYIPSTDSNTANLATAAAALTVGDSQIGIVVDLNTSLFPTSSWTSHKVFVVGAFGGFTLGGNPMAN